MMSAPALIFDLDGTLIDSIPDVAAAVNRMLSQNGRAPITIQQVRGMVGLGVEYLIDCAMQQTGNYDISQRQQFVNAYIEEYRRHPVQDTEIYPGVVDVLSSLHQQRYAMGVCTNKPHQMSVTVLNQLKMHHYFSAVVGAGSIPYKKPDARHIEATLSKMGIEHKHAIMVGDSETDIEAALNFGIPSILVNYGYLNDASVVKKADVVINHFSELPSAIENLQSIVTPAKAGVQEI